MVLGGAEREHVHAVDQREQARLLALEAGLDHDRAAGRAESAAEGVIKGRERLLDRGRDDHPLAGGKPVRLDHDRGALGADVGPRGRGLGVPKRPVARGRDAVADAEVLGERLRALEPGGRASRSERLDPGRLEPVDETQDQRQLRPGDDQLDPLLATERDDAVQIVGRDRHAARLARDRIAARRAQQLAHQRRAGQRPAERMLAPAGADHQQLHRC